MIATVPGAPGWHTADWHALGHRYAASRFAARTALAALATVATSAFAVARPLAAIGRAARVVSGRGNAAALAGARGAAASGTASAADARRPAKLRPSARDEAPNTFASGVRLAGDARSTAISLRGSSLSAIRTKWQSRLRVNAVSGRVAPELGTAA
jgi:hypothetical protein